jgi:hypothetical protein
MLTYGSQVLDPRTCAAQEKTQPAYFKNASFMEPLFLKTVGFKCGSLLAGWEGVRFFWESY